MLWLEHPEVVVVISFVASHLLLARPSGVLGTVRVQPEKQTSATMQCGELSCASVLVWQRLICGDNYHAFSTRY